MKPIHIIYHTSIYTYYYNMHNIVCRHYERLREHPAGHQYIYAQKFIRESIKKRVVTQ